jgi:hypothetical protein
MESYTSLLDQRDAAKAKIEVLKIDLALRLKTDIDVHPVLQSLMYHRLELTWIELQIEVFLFGHNKQGR